MTDRTNYWAARKSTTRRRFLAGTSTSIVGAVSISLVGCGDDDEQPVGDSTDPTATSGPADTPAPGGIPRGGTLNTSRTVNMLTDFLPSSSIHGHYFAHHVYSRLYGYRTHDDYRQFDFELLPDLVDTLEQPDEVTYTFKLKPEATFHDISPINGRRVHPDDIVATLASFRTQERHTQRAAWDNLLEGDVGVPETLDDETIQFKTDGPQAAFLPELAGFYGMIAPQELVEDDDLRAENPIGSGPWMYNGHQSDVQFSFLRNPMWHQKDEEGGDLPYADESRVHIIPSYASQVAQFAAGNLDMLEFEIDDLADFEDMADVVAGPPVTASRNGGIVISAQNEGPPWGTDPRLRQAISRLINRKAYNQVVLYDQGWWLTPVGPGHYWWEDPEDSTDSWAQHYQYDPAEARALLEAAGWDLDESIDYSYSSNGYGEKYVQANQYLIAGLREGGLNIRDRALDHSSEFIGGASSGHYDGLLGSVHGAFIEPQSYMRAYFATGAGLNQARFSDEEVDGWIAQLSTVFDREERGDICRNILRKNGEQMWYIGAPAGPDLRALNRRLSSYRWSPGRQEPTDSWVYASFADA